MASSLCRQAAKSCARRSVLKSLRAAPAAVQHRQISDDSPSFALNIFRGDINTSEVFPYPQVLTEEQNEETRMLVDPTTKFFEEVNDAAHNDEVAEVPADIMKGLAELGAFGLQVPNEHGGLGLTNTQYARLTEIVGAHDLGVGIQIGAHQSIGFKGILLVGTEEQKAKYLPKLASGEWVAAFCLTEPSSGSDANSIRTRAVPSEDGSHYILNGSKIWISNGSIAEVMTVFAQTPVRDEKTGQMVDKVSAFIVQRSFGGVTSGAPEKKMGIKASNTSEVYYDNVKIPKENLLGEYGKGFKVAMHILNNGRFGMGAALTGSMKKMIAQATQFATDRTQFKAKIHTFGAIQEKLARMSAACYATESIAYMLSSNMDRGVTEFQVEAAIGKVFASESAWMVADEAIQIHGGMGFMKETGLERIVRDLRIFRIFEGTNEILRLLIALTGCQFAGASLKKQAKAMGKLDIGAIADFTSKQLLWSTPSGSAISEAVHPELKFAASQAEQCIPAFGAAITSFLQEHGKSAVDQQFALKHYADCAIDIYGMVASLARCTRALEAGIPSASHEKVMAEFIATENAARVMQTLKSMKSIAQTDNYQRMSLLASQMVENGGYIAEHPLGF
ncbi:very long-chain specific acyl-CoA dehydrogenase, mitochondrial-like isoform X2 [Sycon ciliatum]|uniref:very long-chain specific acyl-CoA dehydrogenase, mitochondrial-like isoform X2 n=1 Tax=Sycon ciliatum TaxID=27933 RepID=UPI0031F61A9C